MDSKDLDKLDTDLIITLFDLDGVLIRPGGYRAAVKATVTYFSQQMGLGDLEPSEDDLAFFEAHGVTSEWDMVPICVTFLMAQVIASLNGGLPDLPLQDLFQVIKELKLQITTDYQADFERLVPYLNPAIPAAEALLLAVQAGSLMPETRNRLYLPELLGHTRQPSESITMRVFQNFILGDKGFEQAYSFPAVFQTASYLDLYDLPLLSDQNQTWVESLIGRGIIRPAAMTARPSLRPAGTADEQNVYSPEAEMAMRLTGLGNMPMIGFGSVHYLANVLGVPADNLIKPSPVQALAALAAAMGFGILESLNWAASSLSGNFHNNGYIHLPPKFTLHIFEDSTIGIVACQRAATLLEIAGHTVSLKAWGIAQNTHKEKALHSVGARVFPDVDQAVEEALKEFGR